MTTATKAQLNSVSRQLTAKAQSWGQVAKQLSGMKGKIALSKTENITIHQAFNLLGVHTKSNKYTAQDLGLAWSERLKEGNTMHSSEAMTDNSWRCPLLCKAVPMTAKIGGKSYNLYYVEEGEYKMHKVETLCRVVKAEDKRKNSNDVVVSAQVVLRGLVQSIFVEDTLRGMAESRLEAECVCKAYINMGTASNPNFVEVEKKEDVWGLAESKDTTAKVEVKVTTKKTTKRSSKKAA